MINKLNEKGIPNTVNSSGEVKNLVDQDHSQHFTTLYRQK